MIGMVFFPSSKRYQTSLNFSVVLPNPGRNCGHARGVLVVKKVLGQKIIETALSLPKPKEKFSHQLGCLERVKNTLPNGGTSW